MTVDVEFGFQLLIPLAKSVDFPSESRDGIRQEGDETDDSFRTCFARVEDCFQRNNVRLCLSCPSHEEQYN